MILIGLLTRVVIVVAVAVVVRGDFADGGGSSCVCRIQSTKQLVTVRQVNFARRR